MKFPPARELLPHESPMIVIDEVSDAGEDWVETQLHVTPRHPLFETESDGLPGWTLIELMAQTVGVYAGLHDHAQGKPVRIGYLLGTRRFQLHRQHVANDERLWIRAVREFHDPEGVGAFVCTVRDANDVIAEARLNVYQTSNGEIPA